MEACGTPDGWVWLFASFFLMLHSLALLAVTVIWRRM
jgi:hypothetical protein